MQRLVLSLTVVFLGCLAIPATLSAQTAADYNNQGVDWYNKGEYDKAIADYNKALSLDPNHASTYLNRGCVWDDKGEYDKAIADYSEAIRLKPSDAIAYGNRGNTWNKKGEYDTAGMLRGGLDRLSGLLNQLHRLLVHAEYRMRPIIRFRVRFKDFFHVRYEFGSGFRRNDPVFDLSIRHSIFLTYAAPFRN